MSMGLPGYWSVSMQNLYTAAACLNNVRGIDLRVHPAIAEATWYPIMKEAINLTDTAQRSGMLSGVVNAQQFKTRFRKMLRCRMSFWISH